MSEDTADSASRDSELDATLLNSHLEWLIKVGFSVDKILEWATKEKAKSENSARMTLSEESESTTTVSVAWKDLVIDNNDGDDPAHEGAQASDDLDEPGLDSSVSLSQDSDDIILLDSQSHSGSHPMKQVRWVTPKRTSQHNGKRKLSTHSAASTGHMSKKARPTEDAGSVYSGSATTPRQQRLKIKEKMKQVIEMLKDTSAAKPFITFDECKAADYDKIIEYPMCLNEIRDRINRNQCDSREIFCAEFDEIIKNCQKYHAGNPVRLAQAKRLKHHFDELIKRYLPDDSHLGILDEGLPSDASSADEEEVDDEDTSFLDTDRSYTGEQADGPPSQSDESVLSPEM